MLTAVTERCGSVIRFNDAFLDFLRIFKIVPHACHIRAPQEKGKIEKSIHYLIARLPGKHHPSGASGLCRPL